MPIEKQLVSVGNWFQHSVRRRLLFLQAVPTKCAYDTLNKAEQEYEASPKPTQNEAILQNENHLPKQKISKQGNGANAALLQNAKGQSSNK
ncbi:MAG TPA: hypothetical protein VH280_17015 [Verrucomicrobiae bacterium]|nr:hypothetical protein [Verrucomicrobiae bacterium]